MKARDFTLSVAVLAGVGLAWGAHTVRAARADDLPTVAVEGQPLAANIIRLSQALEMLGRPFDAKTTESLRMATTECDAERIQRIVDSHVVCLVTINPESRVKVERGPGAAVIQQAGFTPLVVKVVNQGSVTARLSITSPQAGAPYAGAVVGILGRQDQVFLNDQENTSGDPGRFLQLEMFDQPPLTRNLSGLEVEYSLALIYSSEAGRREATLGFKVAQGNQDLASRGETPVLFDIRPAIPVGLKLHDDDGRPAFLRLTFRDGAGHVYPPQARRLAPDLFFEPQIYRHDGETVLLPPGKFRVEYGRGPEYRVLEHEFIVPEEGEFSLDLQARRWVHPMRYGFYCGDHHIHGAGCSHYTSPTEGVTPRDMFRQVAGEALNVGCVLTWGPCFDFQRRFFSPQIDEISEPLTLLKYDLEISGFGSQALGHVCLLNLTDQTYPGSEGTATKGWPTWTTPVLKWAKAQGAVTGYAHSASGLEVDPPAAARQLLDELDSDRSGQIGEAEAKAGLMPDEFDALDADRDGRLTEAELARGIERAADRLPNLALPAMSGVGAMELPVSVALGACDFISAMDTPRTAEWNMWYHVLNCGFPLKVSGETDFPCMSSTAVGAGRVYVQLGAVERIDFAAWCAALAAGQSYVSDGYAHPLEFTVNGSSPGATVALDEVGAVEVSARVAFAPETPLAVSTGTRVPEAGRKLVGDTVHLHGKRSNERIRGGVRLVELVVNGRVVASQELPADGEGHEWRCSVPIERSSWVALRHFPQFHTNPVNVSVVGAPIRASRASARWCEAAIHQLWRVRAQNIAEAERPEAEKAFQQAIEIYRRIAGETEGD
ncbi:MAG TPA: CehA/McbA family metallohydrolase [Pirellulales bacterium]|nr:CehA/McbA family metallohydrolase [Pirellulales bacterium]